MTSLHLLLTRFLLLFQTTHWRSCPHQFPNLLSQSLPLIQNNQTSYHTIPHEQLKSMLQTVLCALDAHLFYSFSLRWSFRDLWKTYLIWLLWQYCLYSVYIKLSIFVSLTKYFFFYFILKIWNIPKLVHVPCFLLLVFSFSAINKFICMKMILLLSSTFMFQLLIFFHLNIC